MVIDVNYQSEVDMKMRKIDIYMSASSINNPIIKFLRDLMEHKHIIRKYDLQIHYILGQCGRCREKNFMSKEKGCLSGGRYCVIDTEYRQNELVKETLRQICLRKQYDSEKVIKYLWKLKQRITGDMGSDQWQTGNLEICSWETMSNLRLNVQGIKDCYNDSFKLVGSDDENKNKIDPEIDDNMLLAEEQKEFFEVTQYNIFPLIKINNVFYDENINIRDFLRFGCKNKFFDCRMFRFLRKIIIMVMILLTSICIGIVLLFCRGFLRKKMNVEMDIKVKEAVQKYLVVEKV